MNNLDTTKRLYTKHRRAVMFFDGSARLIWANDMAISHGLILQTDEISQNIKEYPNCDFNIDSDDFSGRCEVECFDIEDQTIYITEFFGSAKSSADSNSQENLRFAVREGVNRIANSIQNIYYDLDESAKEHLTSLNSGMFGCYDVLRSLELTDDLALVESTAFLKLLETVDFSNVVKLVCHQISEVAVRAEFDFCESIQAGVFVKSPARLLISAVSQLATLALIKNPYGKLAIQLSADGKSAKFTAKCSRTKNTAANKKSLPDRANDGYITGLSKTYLESFAKKCNGSLCFDKYGEIIGIELPICKAEDLTFSSGDEGFYRGNRFSKCRILLSGIYNIDYFGE